MLAPVLAATVLVGYGLSLWWLLRRERATAMVWLVGLTDLSVSLRLVYTTQFPNGMNEDETKILWRTIEMLRAGRIFQDDCTGIPALLSVLFDAQLATWIGASRWAVRGLSFLGGTLAVPARGEAPDVAVVHRVDSGWSMANTAIGDGGLANVGFGSVRTTHSLPRNAPGVPFLLCATDYSRERKWVNSGER